jgi:pimeloyl-ACP methyl ester carboxylesterase
MVDVLGCEINVIEHGAGPPILFLHGVPDSSQIWRPIALSLADSYRCIAPDLPGLGRSTVPLDFDYSLDGLAAFVEALYVRLGLEPAVHLVAHDFGGAFAAAWMATHPERVRSFTACNTAFSASYRWHYLARIWRTPLLGELSMLAMNRPLFGLEARRGSRGLTREHIDSTYALLKPSVKAAVLRLYRAVARTSLEDWERRYLEAAKHIPVMVLWGEGDPYIPARFADAFGARKVIRVEGAGHWLPVVEPARFSAELRSFVGSAAARETRPDR